MTDGYRAIPEGGAAIRADIVEVYVFRAAADAPLGCEVLQLRRATAPLRGTWHPVMGHIERGESAVVAALRELGEEVGLAASSPAVRGVWALEQVHPYFVPAIDCIVLSPRFAVEVEGGWAPTLNGEHDGVRWARSALEFLWPGQKLALAEIRDELLPADSPAREHLSVEAFVARANLNRWKSER